MNILQVLPELRVGGVERGTVDLAKYLVKMGHKAVVVSAGGEMVKDLEALGAIHYQLPVHKKSIIDMLKVVPRLEEIIKKENIDIVHARSRIPAWSAFLASRRTQRVFITTCHGYYTKHLFSYVMGWGKKVIVLSNVIARHMIEDFGVPHERIRLIPRSVDSERFSFVPPSKRKHREYNIGIIGRLTPIKGHLYFLKAMARAARIMPKLKIWIVGDAPASKEAYKEQMRVLTRRLGLWHCTEFLGAQKDIPEIMQHLDVLVLATTTQEAFGRVIVEAQAAGVPVVATSVGGVVDIIDDGKTGLLVPPADPQAMADAVVRIGKDPALANALAEQAYARVKERYGVELMVERTLAVYREALEQTKILAIKFSSLGDIILSTAAVRALRQRFPRPRYSLSFLVGADFKDILLRNPHIDELLVCDFKNKDKGVNAFTRLASLLRRKHFDMVIDLQNNRRSHLLAALTMALKRYGYNNKKWGFLLNYSVKDDGAALGPVEHQFRIFKQFGMDAGAAALELFPTAEDQKCVDDFLASHWLSAHQVVVGINASASKRWSSKVWPREHLIRLCEELGRRDIRVVITGTADDRFLVEQLRVTAPGLKLIDSCGKLTINQLACLIKRCQVYISGDSAPLHVAAAMGTPFIALFGPTDPRRHLPPALQCVVIHKQLGCTPCYKSKCARLKCMKAITAEEVLRGIDSLLSLSQGKRP
ncbi:MAG TPA: GT4 family glycosyltransferase PelF [Candidatus Omnitrophota bacterium]|nr:GT4 family glycosyltransferase PelF [Candidatus Omnitrophota bacterium]HRZ14591.1 GT4 family glycosyltransferase PelF [Candidatus Omnitrophota bacterium]